MYSTLTKRAANRAIALTATALLVFGASCADDPASVEPTTVGSKWGPEPAETVTVPTVSTPTASTPTGSALTDEEIAGLMWMREEEQLAHDVYVALGDAWDLRIFDNISRAETTHIDAVAGLLDLYGLDDPAAGNDPGTFTEPALQRLYDQLVADGSRSLEEALEVGAFIEELDIVDLAARCGRHGDPRDLRGLREPRTGLAQPPSCLLLAARLPWSRLRAHAARLRHVRRDRVRATPSGARAADDRRPNRTATTVLVDGPPTMNTVPHQRILVVDDEETIRELVGSYLRTEGFDVVEAVDGEDALAQIAQRAPELIVLDLRLPGISGLDVLREIRRTSAIYVIVLTARADETDKLIGLELGADDYVTKPFSPRELVARVRAVLRRGRKDPLGADSSDHLDDEVTRLDGLTIDAGRHEVTRR